jgi:Ca2+-binding EF-hand superfamily protein
MRDFGIELSALELQQVFSIFDRNGDGFVDIDEFLIGMRGEMNSRRKGMIRMAFNILDRDRSGVITLDEIAQAYDVTWNPDVRSGKKTKDQALREFISQWDGKGGDGLVTYDEFEDYYKGVSASIDDDDYFELMIRNAWRIAGGEGVSANTANRYNILNHTSLFLP